MSHNVETQSRMSTWHTRVAECAAIIANAAAHVCTLFSLRRVLVVECVSSVGELAPLRAGYSSGPTGTIAGGALSSAV